MNYVPIQTLSAWDAKKSAYGGASCIIKFFLGVLVLTVFLIIKGASVYLTLSVPDIFFKSKH